MKNSYVSGSGLVLIALMTTMGALACGGGGGGETSGSGGSGGSSTSTTTTTTSTGGDSTSSSSTTTTSASTTSSTGSGGMATPGLIDDMEDMDGAILMTEGRQGYWYTFNDGTKGGMETPAANMPFAMSAITPPRDKSNYAARMMGTGFTVWGAGMGFDLNAMGMTKSAYDASAYSGITFWAKIGTGTNGDVRVNVADKDTAPEGGVCDKAANKCNDHFGAQITVTDTWKQYTLNFSDLKQVGYGQAFPKILTSALYGIAFGVTQNKDFDVWIDDIAFVK